MRLLLITLVSCSGNGPKSPAPLAPRALWQVRVDVPSELKFNMLTVDGAVADPGERPALFFREGLHALTTSERATLSIGAVTSSTRVVRVEGKEAWTLTLANGRKLQIAHDVAPSDAAWFAIDGGLVAVSAAAETTFARFDEGGTFEWSARVAAVGEGVTFLGNVTSLGHAHGGVVFQLSSERGSEIVVLNLERRTATIALHGHPGRGVLAERKNQLAIVGSERVEVFDLVTGKRLRDLVLPPFSKRTAYSEDATLGFDGGVIWMYFYAPPPRGDMVLVLSDESCGYDVYDATTGRRLRTLDSATGTWKRMTAECAVRALIAQPDGGVVAVRVDGPTQATITKLDRAP